MNNLYDHTFGRDTVKGTPVSAKFLDTVSVRPHVLVDRDQAIAFNKFGLDIAESFPGNEVYVANSDGTKGPLLSDVIKGHPTSAIPYTFNEDKYLAEALEHINSTYAGHYSGQVQATELIFSAGHGIGFCVGDILKYASRYGKKDGYNRKDVLKIIHYAVMLLHVTDTMNKGE